MKPEHTSRYIAAFAKIIGVQENLASEYAERKGIEALVDNAYQLLETPEQIAKHNAFLELYRMSSSIGRQNPILSSPTAAASYMHSVLEKVHDKESMVVAFLNTKNRVIDYEQVSIGTINSSLIHPREIFRNAILNKAVSVLICHNHPSGDLTPSDEDKAATKALKEAGELLGIPVVDHIIITGINRDDVYSFRAQGVLEQHAHYATGHTITEKPSSYKEKDKDQQLDEITAKLEEGIKDVFTSGKYEEYLKVMSRFHKYSVNNTLLIAMQNPDASLVAGYHAWQKKFERHVLKGEKAIRIIAPVPEKKIITREKVDPVTQKPVLDQEGKPIMEEQELINNRFKAVPVFDVSQTEGKELPTLTKELAGPVRDYALLFDAIKLASPVPVEIQSMKANRDGYYHLKDKRIAIRRGMGEAQTLATLVHELAHAKLHDTLDIGKSGKDQRTQEVEAESIAYAVCQYFGIETAENSFGYIAGWSGDKELDELKSSLKTIRDTASNLINAIDEKLLTLQKEREPLPNEKEAAVTHLTEKVVALAETISEYAETPEHKQNIPSLGNVAEIKSWLGTIVKEGAFPYNAQAKEMQNQFEALEQGKATYLLENGERLVLNKADSHISYKLQDALGKKLSEGFVTQPGLLLDAAKDMVLHENGREGIGARLLSDADIEKLNSLAEQEPQVTFHHSQHKDLPNDMHLPLSQANRLVERLDKSQSIEREKRDLIKKEVFPVGFRIDYIKDGIPETYSGKQEIGRGEGSLTMHMQAHIQNTLNKNNWKVYEKAAVWETEQGDYKAAFRHSQEALLPYFNSHSALSYLKERTNTYMAQIDSMSEDRKEGLRNYYQDVNRYVLESRRQLNLYSEPHMPSFPQLETYIQVQDLEQDFDHDGAPQRVDINDQDSRVQLMHHKDKLGGAKEKPSIRERLKAQNGIETSSQHGKRKEIELS